MRLPVIVSDPLADDLLQLVQEVKRLVLDVLAAAVNIRALIAGQRDQQALSQGPEEPLQRSLGPRRRLHPIPMIGTDVCG